MTKKSNDKQASKVTKAFTTSAIIAGGLAIPSIYSGVAHADEISQDKTAENTTQQDVNTQNNQAETTQVDTSKEIIEDVSNDASKEDVTNFPDAKASSDAKVETTQAPTTQPSTEDTSDQADAPKSEDKVTSEDTVQEQPKEEVQSTEDTSDQAETPKSEDKVTSNDTVQEQPKEETSVNTSNDVDTTNNNTTSTTDSELTDAQVNNTPVSPFAALTANVNETTGSTPNNEPTDSANTLLSQPVVASRTTRTTEDSNATNVTVQADAESSSVLSSDKYTITSLTGKFVKGDDKNYDSYDTHMTMKLDDSVKGGDKIVYGIQYEYKDLDGTYKAWLGSTGSDKAQTVDIMYEGKNVGTMTLYPHIDRAKNMNPDFEIDSLNGANITTNIPVSQPVEVTFNDNINDLKGVEITLDNSFVQRDEKTVFQDIDYNYMYVSKDSKSPNVVKNEDGLFVKLPKSFVVNDEPQDLDVLYHAKEHDSAIDENKLDNFGQVWRIQTRTYETDANGDEYLKTDPNFSAWIAVTPSKQPTNQFTSTITIPKELEKYADFTVRDNDSAFYPQESGSKGDSKFNPLTSDEDVYTGWHRRAVNHANDGDWERTVNETTNSNGDRVIEVTYKTKDGSFKELSSSNIPLIYYKFKEELPHSEVEKYADADARPAGEKWGIPEWDKVLAENPIQFDTKGTIKDADGKTTDLERKYNYSKETYVIRNLDVKNASDGSAKITADKERTEKEPHSETIPFETITRENSNLAKGETRVIQEGKNGTHSWTDVIKYVNDKEVSRTVTDEKLVPKQDKIVEVGTGIVDQKVTTKDTEIPYDTITRENKDLPEGTRNVIQEGITGLERTTTTQKTIDGKPDGEPTIKKETIREKQDEIIEVGKGVVDKDIKVNDKEIPFETITRENKDLPEGKTRVVQEGITGLERTTTTTPTLNGQPNGEPTIETETVREKQDKIVEVGTGVEDVSKTVEKEEIPYETITRENKDLPEGTRNVIQKGITGERTITTVQPTFNGEPKGEPTITSAITKEKVDEIVEVGTGVVGTDVENKDRELPFNVIERVNTELPVGTRNVIQEGKTGLERTTITYDTLNGNHTNVKDVKTSVITKPQDRIVEIGAGVEGKNVTVVETVKPFETITRENKDLPEGMQRIVQHGVDGIVRATTVETTYNGEVTNKETTNDVVQEKVDQIIEIGTGVVGFNTQDIPKTTPHNTITRENKDLPKGERRVIQEGHDGRTITRIVTPTLNGQPNGKSEVVVITIDEPKDTIIEVGTKEEAPNNNGGETPNNNDKGNNNKEETPNNNDKGNNNKEETPDNNDKDDNTKEETPNNNDNQYPTPDHSNDHDGIHDMTPQPEHHTTTTQETTTGAKVTVQDQTPQQNGIQITEKENGQLVVTVMPKASASHAYNGQTVEAPHVTKEQQDNNNQASNKELPATGQTDNSKGGLLATIAAIFGLGLLKSRRKDSKTEK